MIEFATLVLGKIAEAFLSALAGEITKEVWSKLQPDPVKIALKQAVGAAIQRYATSPLRLDLARPLLEKDVFLTLPVVAQELTQLVRFEHEPNADLIGQQWKAALDNPPPWCDFTYETKRLLEYLEIELRSTEVFRPVFDAKRLDAIAASCPASTESLAHIEALLADLAQLMDTRLSDLIRIFAGASINLREPIRDYTRFLKEKTHDFVGRQFVFDAITHFTETHPRGYFFIRGDPGIGKSALAAQIVRTNGYVHHFNIKSEGINRTETFLRNMCAQLIVVYKLNYTFLPPEAIQDTGFLNRLLGEISDTLKANEKAIIVVDALDEVDTLGLSPGVNTLYLPVTLPQGLYVIVTTRKIPINLRIDCEQGTLDIEHDSAGNIADIREYVARAVGRPGIQAYITAQGIDNELFIEHLVEKSEGNFMYLHYVLPEIEHGYYTDLGLEALPTGLENYYEDHWRHMRDEATETWFKYKLPILMALAAAEYPVSIDMIMAFSGTREHDRVVAMLQEKEWGQFLHKEEVSYEGSIQKRYSLYHASFQEFLVHKDELEEGVSFIRARKGIIASYRSKLKRRGDR